MKPGILIIDDKEKLCRSIARNFEHLGYSTAIATTSAEAVASFSGGGFEAVLLDVMLGADSGVDVLRRLMEIDGSVPVIMITAYASVETAVSTLKLGAFDYVRKPLDFDELLKTVEKAREFRRLRKENTDLKERVRELSSRIVTRNPPMEDIVRKVEKLAATELSVLILGESGTGKEVIADNLHAASSRGSLPMVKVNCAALPESLLDNELFGHEKGAYTGADSSFKGLFEKADRSTLFLDEIGDMPTGIQAKILRALQNAEIRRLGGGESIKVDVRFIAATNRDPEELIRSGKFREDLYYRLNAAVIAVPPLRERKEDIPLLLDRFLSPRKRPSQEILARFMEYDWPGNVRELMNVANYAAAMCSGDTIRLEDLPVRFLEGSRPAGSGNIRTEMERDLILRTLQGTQYNRSRAAELLGMSRKTLYSKMARYGLNV